jgi:hypothetical protein
VPDRARQDQDSGAALLTRGSADRSAHPIGGFGGWQVIGWLACSLRTSTWWPRRLRTEGWTISLASTGGNFWPVGRGLKARGVADRAGGRLDLAGRDRELPVARGTFDQRQTWRRGSALPPPFPVHRFWYGWKM